MIWLVVIPATAIFPIVLAVAYVVWSDRSREEPAKKPKRAR